MNPFFAYGQLIVGLPLMIAWALLYAPNYLIEKMWPGEEVNTYYYMGKCVVEGAVSMLTAYFIFELLYVEPTIWIPVILYIVVVLWKTVQGEAFMLMFMTPGLLLGYKLFPFIRPYIARW
jgi:hypothetical protein